MNNVVCGTCCILLRTELSMMGLRIDIWLFCFRNACSNSYYHAKHSVIKEQANKYSALIDHFKFSRLAERIQPNRSDLYFILFIHS